MLTRSPGWSQPPKYSAVTVAGRAGIPSATEALGQGVTNDAPDPTRLPSMYLGHGAPPLVDDPIWPSQLRLWSDSMPRPKAILVVSAHWENAPLTLGATS